MNMACYEQGLLWTGTGLLWVWTVMHVVCNQRVFYERVCYERGLSWTGLSWTWSV